MAELTKLIVNGENIENKVSYLVDSGNMKTRGLSSIPTWGNGESFFFTTTAGLVLNDSLTIPQYSKGVWISSGQDVVIICIDSSRNLYLCFRNGSTWYGRKLQA